MTRIIPLISLIQPEEQAVDEEKFRHSRYRMRCIPFAYRSIVFFVFFRLFGESQ